MYLSADTRTKQAKINLAQKEDISKERHRRRDIYSSANTPDFL
jgi:hypothetical protein